MKNCLKRGKGQSRGFVCGPARMVYFEAEGYQADVQKDVDEAKKKLEEQIGSDVVPDIGTAVEEAKQTIEKSRESAIGSIAQEQRFGTTLDKREVAAHYSEEINKMANSAIAEINANSADYKTRHEAHLQYAKIRLSLLNPEVNKPIWEVANGLEGFGGEKAALDIDKQIGSLPGIQSISNNMATLSGLSAKAAANLSVLEPKAEELRGIVANLGDLEPSLKKNVKDMLASVDEKIAQSHEAISLYNNYLARLKETLPTQLQSAVAKEADLKNASAETQQKGGGMG
ncbi:hypothetical protein KKH03_02035, partial [Patescibacteria group bacterium]|nr:hypothetical protein [Patescibacteria group bacterium]